MNNKQHNTTTRRPRKRKRSRLRWDRISLVCGTFIAIVIGLFILTSRACDDNKAEGQTDRPDAAAARAGIRDASRAAATKAGSMDRQEALFQIYSVESQLRNRGYNNAAKSYIDAVNHVFTEKGLKKWQR